MTGIKNLFESVTPKEIEEFENFLKNLPVSLFSPKNTVALTKIKTKTFPLTKTDINSLTALLETLRFKKIKHNLPVKTMRIYGDQDKLKKALKFLEEIEVAIDD